MAGTELAMHATVTVHDLDRFVEDPTHTGNLVGSVDFSPLGTGMPAGDGVFRLFSPSEDPRMRHMVYELPFEHAGEKYYVAGHKEVRDDPGFDMWKDTTTLYTQLHQGSDRSGPVIGAGILSLGPTDLARMVAGMRATGATNPGDSAKVVARFGRFFAGELWDRYVAGQ
jgi:cholesterol oxidase